MSGPINTYISNVPQASQYIRATQKPIQSNFLAISELLSVNHVGFNDAENFGKHNFTSLPSQSVTPTTLSSEMVVYCAPSTGYNPYELFYRYPSNGSVVQLTGTSNSSSDITDGYAYISGAQPTTNLRAIMKWGLVTGLPSGSVTTTVNFPTGAGIPAFVSTPAVSWCFQGVPSSAGVDGLINGIAATGFQWFDNGSSGTWDIYYIAIGQGM